VWICEEVQKSYMPIEDEDFLLSADPLDESMVLVGTAVVGGADAMDEGADAMEEKVVEGKAVEEKAPEKVAPEEVVEKKDLKKKVIGEVAVRMKTKDHMCRFHEKNNCERGHLCAWAHSEDEIGQVVPDAQQLKVTLCQYYQKGRCNMPSHKCAYAHGADELGKKKPAAVLVKGPHSDKGREQKKSASEKTQRRGNNLVNPRVEEVNHGTAPKSRARPGCSSGAKMKNAGDRPRRSRSAPARRAVSLTARGRKSSSARQGCTRRSDSSSGQACGLHHYSNLLSHSIASRQDLISKIAMPFL